MSRDASDRPGVSNTGLSNEKKDISSVSSGVDTLVANLMGDLPDDLLWRLVELKEVAAQRAKSAGRSLEPEPVACAYSFGGLPLYVLPYARRGWLVVLHNEWIDVSLGEGGVSGVTARLRLSSAYLHGRLFVDSVSDLQAWAFTVFGQHAVLQAAEVHLYRDTTGYDIAAADASGDLERHAVCRAATWARVGVYKQTQTVAIGRRGGAISAIIYDKTAELAKSGKGWFRERWAANGWDGKSPVWRVEFRCGRELLRESGIETLFDLLDQLEALWSYCTGSWFRHVERGKGEVSDRVRQLSAVSPWWAVVARPLEDEAPCELTRERKRAFDAEKLAAQAVGCLVSYFSLKPGSESLAVSGLLEEVETVLRMTQRRKGQPVQVLISRRQARYAAAA